MSTVDPYCPEYGSRPTAYEECSCSAREAAEHDERMWRVLVDLSLERQRQIAKGWTREHDDTHETRELVRLAYVRAYSSGDGTHSRRLLIESAAMLVAAIEVIDRREAGVRHPCGCRPGTTPDEHLENHADDTPGDY